MRVFLTPPAASDFDTVAAALREAGHTVSGRTHRGCSRADKDPLSQVRRVA
jgi:hypothetical protein